MTPCEIPNVLLGRHSHVTYNYGTYIYMYYIYNVWLYIYTYILQLSWENSACSSDCAHWTCSSFQPRIRETGHTQTLTWSSDWPAQPPKRGKTLSSWTWTSSRSQDMKLSWWLQQEGQGKCTNCTRLSVIMISSTDYLHLFTSRSFAIDQAVQNALLNGGITGTCPRELDKLAAFKNFFFGDLRLY